MPGERRISHWIEVDYFPFIPQRADLFTKELHFLDSLYPPGPPVASWTALQENLLVEEDAQRCSQLSVSGAPLAPSLSRSARPRVRKIHWAIKSHGHSSREVVFCWGEAQLESCSWEIDLFAAVPTHLGPSLTVSSELIILSTWSTRLAWQRVERRSFSPAETSHVRGYL